MRPRTTAFSGVRSGHGHRPSATRTCRRSVCGARHPLGLRGERRRERRRVIEVARRGDAAVVEAVAGVAHLPERPGVLRARNGHDAHADGRRHGKRRRRFVLISTCRDCKASPRRSPLVHRPDMPPARSRRATALRAALALGLGSAILGLLLAHLPIAQAFEWSIYDLRMRRTIAPAGAPKQIAIVEIDEQTLRALEPIAGRWPWPRLFHGGLIDYLARGPAAVVAYDVGFFEAGRPHRVRRRRRHVDRRRIGRGLRGVGPEGRQRRAAGRGHLRRFRRRQGRRRPPGRRRSPACASTASSRSGAIVRAPFEALAQAARGLGHNLFVLDTDGPLRRTTPFLRSEGHPVPSLAMAAYLALARVPPASVRLDGRMLAAGDARLPLLSFEVPRLPGEAGAERALHALIRFRGPAVQADGTPTYRTYSFGDLIAVGGRHFRTGASRESTRPSSRTPSSSSASPPPACTTSSSRRSARPARSPARRFTRP